MYQRSPPMSVEDMLISLGIQEGLSLEAAEIAAAEVLLLEVEALDEDMDVDGWL